MRQAAAEWRACDGQNKHGKRGPKPIVPDVFSYSAAISACANAGMRQEALALLEEMRQEGVSPNVRHVGPSEVEPLCSLPFRILPKLGIVQELGRIRDLVPMSFCVRVCPGVAGRDLQCSRTRVCEEQPQVL